MLSYLMGSLCGGVTTYNILVYLSSISIDHMSLLSVYFKSKKKTQLRAITKWSWPKVMLQVFQIQCHQFILFFYYSSRFVLDNHHLSTDTIKFMSQQVIIARLTRGFDSGIELSEWIMPVATTQYPSILQFKNWHFM